MKAKLEFDLAEEKDEFENCVDAGRMYNFIFELVNNYIRNRIKYGELNEEVEDTLVDVQDWCVNELESLGIGHKF